MATLEPAAAGAATGVVGDPNDGSLVREARGGSQAAFTLLVQRYQNLVSSLAYTQVGSFTESEEIAQEVFVVAWSRLGDLREPDHFRRWLCGITRYLGHRRHREHRTRRRPGARGGAARDFVSADPSPLDELISREEERALWAALGEIPESYRVPLVLFYREHDSMERVAEALDISVETVRQRLSRGRRMLQERVMPRIESALRSTRAGKRFSAAVVAALAAGATSGDAAAASRHARGRAVAGLSLGLLARLAFVAAVAGAGGLLVLRSGGNAAGDHAAAPSAEASKPGVRGAASRASSSSGGGVSAPPAAASASMPGTPAKPAELLAYDFEEGALPLLFWSGHVLAGPPHEGSRWSAIATISPNFHELPALVVMNSRQPLFHYSETATISFDYWASPNVDRIWVNSWGQVKKVNYNLAVKPAVFESWGHAEIRAKELAELGAGKPVLEDGDAMETLGFRCPAGGQLYIDNIKVIDYYDPKQLPGTTPGTAGP